MVYLAIGITAVVPCAGQQRCRKLFHKGEDMTPVENPGFDNACLAEIRHDLIRFASLQLRDDALAAKLVDRIGFRDEAYARVGELTGGAAEADGKDAPPRLFLSRYAKATAGHTLPEVPPLPGRKHKPTIAVVTVAGPIVSGRGGPQLSPLGRSSAGGDTVWVSAM